MFDRFDLALLVIAGYVAVLSLVRLMLVRRNDLLNQFCKEMAADRQRTQVEEIRRRREEAKKKANEQKKETAA